MTKNEIVSTEALLKQTLEATERMIYKNGDEIAIGLARSFERLEECIKAMEARLDARLAELADQIANARSSANAH